MTTVSFHNDPALKATHVAQAQHHADADMLIAGTYDNAMRENFRACSVGCFAHDIDPKAKDKHAVIAEARGLPAWLVRLQDTLFEGLPDEQRAAFHVDLANRIPVGVDLAPVQHWIAVARIDRMLVTQRKALKAKHAHGVTEAIAQVIAALEISRRVHEAAAGGNVSELPAAYSAASAAGSAAYLVASAADSSARSVAHSAASAARSVAHSAASAARSAAYSAAYSAGPAARSAADSAAYIAERDSLFTALDRAALQPEGT